MFKKLFALLLLSFLVIGAASAADFKLNDGFEQVTDYIEENIKYAIDYINKYIPQIKVNTPDSTYLLWLDCRNLNLNGDELLDFFINKAKIAPNDGRIFGEGGEGYMRINIACSRKVLEKAMHQLKVSVDEYLFDKYELLCGC